MAEFDLYARIGLALAIGLMIGFERGWHSRAESEGHRVAGIRTFALIGLAGGIVGALTDELGSAFAALAFVALTAIIVVGHLGRLRIGTDYGVTTQIAAMATFALGLMAVLGDMAVAAAAGVVVTALLASKSVLHGWLERINQLELSAGIQLLIISVVLLPVLPDRGFGPGGVLNPYVLWWIVVLLAGLSFVGYVAVRIAGPRRGVLLTGLLGGMVSSTAVTVHLSRLARGDPALMPVAATGVTAASAMMYVRILIVVSILNPALVPTLLWPVGAMTAAAAVLAVLMYRRQRGNKPPGGSAMLVNPLELGPALGFALFLALIVLLGQLARDWLGTAGLYALAAAAGLSDVDAVTVLMARMAGPEVTIPVAVTAIAIAAFVNTAVKGGIAAVIAGGGMARRAGLPLSAIVAAGAAALLLT